MNRPQRLLPAILLILSILTTGPAFALEDNQAFTAVDGLLYRINLSTAQLQFVGNGGGYEEIGALTFDPTTASLLAFRTDALNRISTDDGSTLSSLPYGADVFDRVGLAANQFGVVYLVRAGITEIIDKSSGAPTFVGSNSLESAGGAAFGNDGLLYVTGEIGGAFVLARINPTTGALQDIIGALHDPGDPDLQFAGLGMDFDSSGTLYLVNSFRRRLYTVSLTDGQLTLVGNIALPFRSLAVFKQRPGDIDLDGDVDLDDYQAFEDCLAGPDESPTPTSPITTQQCLDAFDLDNDLDVDLKDFTEFRIAIFPFLDCNNNGLADADDVAAGTSLDCNTNSVPDECEPDCNMNGTPDNCDVAAGSSLDCNSNNVPDDCDIADWFSRDCNANAIPDECDIQVMPGLDSNTNGFLDQCDPDCNSNGIPDDLELSAGSQSDCNSNTIPDECEVQQQLRLTSPVLQPITAATPVSFLIRSPQPATGAVTLIASANAILGSPTRYLDVYMNETFVGRMYRTNGEFCSTLRDSIVLDVDTYNEIAQQGSILVRVVASDLVTDECGYQPWIQFSITYSTEGGDCNGNQIPDICDLALGTSFDNDGDNVADDCQGDIHYVNPAATGTNDGSSWTNAFVHLQDALAATQAFDRIWVAAGTYQPDCDMATCSGDRAASFVLSNGVAVYGGFAGNETRVDQRAWSNNVSTLTGDLAGDDGPGQSQNSENSHHVVRATALGSHPTLDGFTITGGNSDSGDGAGVYVDSAELVLRNCRVESNSAARGAGLFIASNGGPNIINCLFRDNNASVSGGAAAIFNSAPWFVNCTILDNVATSVGGGVYVVGGDPTFANSLLWGNSGISGPGEDSQLYLFTGLATVNYSLVEGWSGFLGGDGNIDANPDFQPLSFSPSASSPCIDAGASDLFPVYGQSDLLSGRRFVDDPRVPAIFESHIGRDAIDIGAVEFRADCNTNGVVDFDDIYAGTSNDCGSNWIPDECEPDCNSNAIADSCDLYVGTSADCTLDSIPDECNIAMGLAADVDSNGIPDFCEADCNGNAQPDHYDIAIGSSTDCQPNGVPDECEWLDCNSNSVLDECDILFGTSTDCQVDGQPDDCQLGSYDVAFDGLDAYINIPGYGALRPVNDFTIEARVFLSGYKTHDMTIIAHASNGGGDDGYSLAVTSSGFVRFSARNPNGAAQQSVVSMSRLIPGAWHHVAGVYEDSTLHVYVNGHGTTKAASGNVVYEESVSVYLGKEGNSQLPGTNFFQGELSEIRFWNLVRSQEDIRANMYRQISPTLPGLIGYWTLSDGSGINVSDDASQFTATLRDGATWNPLDRDCNGNALPDSCDLVSGTSSDISTSGIPDECEPDCDSSGVVDAFEIRTGVSADLNNNGILDQCEGDCNANQVPDDSDVSNGTSQDCNYNAIPDECDIAGGTDTDCDQNGVPDSCDLLDGERRILAFYIDYGRILADISFDNGGLVEVLGSSLAEELPGLATSCDRHVWGLTAGGRLTEIDPDTGMITTIGVSTGLNWIGAAFDCTTETLYGSSRGGGNQLHTISTETGAASLVGPFTTRIAGLAFDNENGILYGGSWETIWEIDPTTANMTMVCTNLPIGEGGLGYADGVLIALHNASTYRVNPDDCSWSLIGHADTQQVAAGNALTIVQDRVDCNSNGIYDGCDISEGTAGDCDSNGVPDLCEANDCNTNSIADNCELAAGSASDCNVNALLDECDIASMQSDDVNGNNIPDECEPDCNANDIPDAWDITIGTSSDCQLNGVPDECEPDCNNNTIADECDISASTSADCQTNGVPDECEADCDTNGIPDFCEIAFLMASDCNTNGIPDVCDIAPQFSMSFDGVGAYVDVGNGLDADSGFSIEAWILALDNIGKHTIISKRATSPQVSGYAFFIENQRLVFTLLGELRYETTSNVIVQDQWMHVAATLDNANDVRFYVNGVLVDTVVGIDPPITGNGQVFIGGVPPTNSSPWYGNIDQLRIWNERRLSADIQNSMWMSLPSATPNLAAQWLFDEGQGSLVSDTQGVNDGIIVGTAWDSDVPIAVDCNSNSIPDDCDIAASTSLDMNMDGFPDECD